MTELPKKSESVRVRARGRWAGEEDRVVRSGKQQRKLRSFQRFFSAQSLNACGPRRHRTSERRNPGRDPMPAVLVARRGRRAPCVGLAAVDWESGEEREAQSTSLRMLLILCKDRESAPVQAYVIRRVSSSSVLSQGQFCPSAASSFSSCRSCAIRVLMWNLATRALHLRTCSSKSTKHLEAFLNFDKAH